MADGLFNQAVQDADQYIDYEQLQNCLPSNFDGGILSPRDENNFSSNYFNSSTLFEGYETMNDASRMTMGDFGQLSGQTNQNFDMPIQNPLGIAETSRSSSGSNVGYSALEEQMRGSFNVKSPTSQVSSTSTYQTAGVSQANDQYEFTSRNLYHDPNPEIIRRPAVVNGLTYTQQVKVRFLKPPPLPPPGPIIIKEVRPPQPPLLPPLRIRQQARPHPELPPLILRERPPPPPRPAPSQTVIRNLPPLPPPPRSVIIERLPAAPAKPRDIIIERWMPYETTSKRKTIVERAEAAKPYPPPRNIIIQYEPIPVHIVRRFERLGVTQEDPQAYLQRYGNSVLDTQTLIEQAQAAGVLEDLSPPVHQVWSSNKENNVRVQSSSTSNQHQRSDNHSKVEQGSESKIDDLNSSIDLKNLQNQESPVTDNFYTYSIDIAEAYDPLLAVFRAADVDNDGGLNEKEFRQFLSSKTQ